MRIDSLPDIIDQPDIDLVISPVCRGCTKWFCQYNGPVMVKWKAEQLKGSQLIKCNSNMKKLDHRDSKRIRKGLLKEIIDGLKFFSTEIRSL